MSIPLGGSIFPLTLITQPIPAEFNNDTINQLLELIAQQCAPASGAAFTGGMTVAGNITEQTVGSGFIQKVGTNGRAGTFTLNGATPVTIANTSITATDFIGLSLNTAGGTVGVQPHVSALTSGTGFSVVGTASDTSVYNYSVIGAA